MTFEDFNRYREELTRKRLLLMETKGVEYSHSSDRFDNFNRLARRTGVHRNSVWLVYFTKHMDAIESAILFDGTKSESLESRIMDAINYLELLGGMYAEGDYRLPSAADLDIISDEPRANETSICENHQVSKHICRCGMDSK